jgi:hypothetical protein
MKKAKIVKQKVMGRPRTGVRPLMGFRADATIRASIVRWAENQRDTPSLSEAIRRLVEIGLSKAKPPKQPQTLSTAKQSAARAAEMAAKTIDKRMDPDAPAEEREVRKRKLIQGPSAFRDARRDRPVK